MKELFDSSQFIVSTYDTFTQIISSPGAEILFEEV
jgi:hypothetical protein